MVLHKALGREKERQGGRVGKERERGREVEREEWKESGRWREGGREEGRDGE